MIELDICIPVYRNLRCLDVAVAGLRYWMAPARIRQKLLFHVQLEEEVAPTVAIAERHGFDSQVVSVGTGPQPMAQVMDGLFNRGESPWVVMMEQDTLVRCDLARVAARMAGYGFSVAGPVDNLFFDNSNARARPQYGLQARVSPSPGYYHSSLIMVERGKIKVKTPFTIPAGFQLHGTGVLGAESYYGLRINAGLEKSQLGFFSQRHGGRGYSAEIWFDGQLLATHLYYSGTKTGYLKDGAVSQSEHDWLLAEEEASLREYERAIGRD